LTDEKSENDTNDMAYLGKLHPATPKEHPLFFNSLFHLHPYTFISSGNLLQAHRRIMKVRINPNVNSI